MKKDQLLHILKASRDISEDNEFYIFGSQAILAYNPEGNSILTASIEVDIIPKNKPERSDCIDGALGELSNFHETYGYYAHGIGIEAATLPDGWEKRLKPIYDENETGQDNPTGWCLEVHDLAISKLSAFREKDKAFIRALYVEKMIDPSTILKRIKITDFTKYEDKKEIITNWALNTFDELKKSTSKKTE